MNWKAMPPPDAPGMRDNRKVKPPGCLPEVVDDAACTNQTVSQHLR
jgi:hypothetical protein